MRSFPQNENWFLPAKMKILQLTKKFPFPVKDGESIAITSLAEAMANEGHQVDLLAMNTLRHYYDLEEDGMPHEASFYSNVELVIVDNRLKPLDALVNLLFSKESYHIVRFVSEEYRKLLVQMLQQEDYDIVQLETLFLAPYVETIRKHSKAKIVLRSHNVEFEIWRRITDNTAKGPKKWYLNLLTNRLRKYERAMLNEYDLLVAITQRDLRFLKKEGCQIPSHVTPIGLNLSEYNGKSIDKKKPTCCFIGSLDWMPNIEGVEWLLENVWPKVIKQVPKAEFHIAGRNTPDSLRNLFINGVRVHGEVDDAVDFINQHDIMLVPLFSGSGMRVKILEGMALGKTIVSTSIGLEGIPVQNGKEAEIQEDVDGFVEAVVRCMDVSYCKELGENARLFLEEHFETDKIARDLLVRYQQFFEKEEV